MNEASYQQTLGQTTPGLNWVFYYPAFWHNGYGTLALGRPNRFRLDGYWVTPLRLSVGLQAFVESGAPLNRLGYYSCCGAVVYLEPRGSAGRLPTYWEANLTLSYPIAIGPVTATLQAYLYNLFDNQIATSREEGWTTSPPPKASRRRSMIPTRSRTTRTTERSPAVPRPGRSRRDAIDVLSA